MSEIETSQVEAKLNLTDRAFKGLPIPSVKVSVEKIISHIDVKQIDVKQKVEEIVAGEITIIGEGGKGRFIDKSAGYYVYTLKLSDNTEMNVIFYSHTNHKVLVGYKKHFEEINIVDDKTLLDKISGVYPLPVYTKDALGGIRLIAI